MKAQTTAIVAILAVLGLVLASTSAITYSWWSDSEEAEITITSGSLDVSTDEFDVRHNGVPLGTGLGSIPGLISIQYDDGRSATTKWWSESDSLIIAGNPSNVGIEILYEVTFSGNIDYKYIIDVVCPEGIDATVSVKDEGNNAVTYGSWKAPASEPTEPFSMTFKVSILITSIDKDVYGEKLKIVNMITQYMNPVWDGNIPDSLDSTTLEVEPVLGTQTGTITINSPEDLVYLNTLAKKWVMGYSNGNGTDIKNYYIANGGKGTDYYYHWNWDIILATDLDMNSIPMDSIDISYWGIFNGNGHTISNVVLNDGQAGLFKNGTKLIKDLMVENIVVNSPGVQNVGAVADKASMNNVHVENATVTGGKYVGGLVGKGSSFIGCSVKNSIITGTEKTVGGLVGYSVGDPNAASVIENYVDNVTVTGAYNVGGLLGQAQNVTVDKNTVKNSIVNSTEKLPSDASSNEVRTKELAARSGFTTTTIGTDNIIDNVKQFESIAVSNSTDLQNAINNGKSAITLGKGEYVVTLYTNPANKNLTIIGQGADTKLSFSNQQVRLALFDTLTISNCTIEHMATKSWGHLVFGSSEKAGGDYTISNCIFNGVGTQGIYINQNFAATFNIDNCIFNGDFGGEGAITIQNNDGVNITVNVTDCEFNNVTEKSHEIFMKYAYNGLTLNADGVNVYWNSTL